MSSVVLYAQDRIYKKNGEVIESKVKEINAKTIVFKKWNNLDGPDYSIPKNDANKIVFQNGVEEIFSTEAIPTTTTNNTLNSNNTTPQTTNVPQEVPKNKKTYGKNIISLAPIQMTNSSVLGIGFQYERVLDENAIISFYLPMAFANVQISHYNSQDRKTEYYYGNMTWLYPGLKIYPTGSNHIVSYAVGPSLAIGKGSVPVYNNDDSYDYNTGTYTNGTYRKVDKFQIGVMINNSLNIQASPKIHIGTELGLGLPYNNQSSDKDDDYNELPLVQFNFNLGYRF